MRNQEVGTGREDGHAAECVLIGHVLLDRFKMDSSPASREQVIGMVGSASRRVAVGYSFRRAGIRDGKGKGDCEEPLEDNKSK